MSDLSPISITTATYGSNWGINLQHWGHQASGRFSTRGGVERPSKTHTHTHIKCVCVKTGEEWRVEPQMRLTDPLFGSQLEPGDTICAVVLHTDTHVLLFFFFAGTTTTRSKGIDEEKLTMSALFWTPLEVSSHKCQLLLSLPPHCGGEE